MQLLALFVFLTLPIFAHQIAVVSDQPETILSVLEKEGIADALFLPVSNQSIFALIEKAATLAPVVLNTLGPLDERTCEMMALHATAAFVSVEMPGYHCHAENLLLVHAMYWKNQAAAFTAANLLQFSADNPQLSGRQLVYQFSHRFVYFLDRIKIFLNSNIIAVQQKY